MKSALIDGGIFDTFGGSAFRCGRAGHYAYRAARRLMTRLIISDTMALDKGRLWVSEKN